MMHDSKVLACAYCAILIKMTAFIMAVNFIKNASVEFWITLGWDWMQKSYMSANHDR